MKCVKELDANRRRRWKRQRMMFLDVESFCDKVRTCSRCWADNDGGMWCWGDCPKTAEQKQATSDVTSEAIIEEYIEEEIPAKPAKKIVKVSEHDICWMALYIAVMCNVSQEQAYLRLEKCL